MNVHNDDDQKIIDLYQATREAQPSVQLDHKILLAAKNKLAPKQKKPKRIIWALSSVAVIVLSVNVALKLLVAPTSMPAAYAPKLEHQAILQDMSEGSDNELLETAVSPENNFKLRKQVKKKAIKRVQTAEQKKMINAKPPAALPIETMSMDAMPIKAMPISNVLNNNHVLPHFPFDVEKLRLLYPTLNVKEKAFNSIQILSETLLILNLERLSNGTIKLSAYPQYNELSLNIDWGMPPNCDANKVDKQCSMNKQQTAFFKNNHLMKVSWIQ